MPKRCLAYTEPISANCTSHSACTSEFAPASSSTVGFAPGTGIGVAIAGRFTPEMRPMRSRAAAIVAPVLPAEIIALARPSRTASAARTSVESFLRRTPWAGSSCIPMTSVASIRSSTDAVGTGAAVEVGGPDEHDGYPRSSSTVRSGEDRPGSVVAAHGVDGDGEHAVAQRISRRRRRPGRGTSHTTGTRRAGSWRCRNAGTGCVPARSAARRSPDGCGSSTSMSSSSERPSFAFLVVVARRRSIETCVDRPAAGLTRAAKAASRYRRSSTLTMRTFRRRMPSAPEPAGPAAQSSSGTNPPSAAQRSSRPWCRTNSR